MYSQLDMEEPIDHGIYDSQKRNKSNLNTEEKFRSDQINFLSTEIELVRNRFVYAKLGYEHIHSITVKNGYLINNRWIIRIMACITIYLTIHFILYGLSMSGGIKQMNSAQWFNRGSIIAVWGPILLIIAAGFAMYQTFIKSPIFTITAQEKKYVVRVKSMAHQQTLDQLLDFLHMKDVKLIDIRQNNHVTSKG